MDWGASYGDNMHFDLRNTKVGGAIYSAIHDYVAEVS
jgi:hypothetical protein